MTALIRALSDRWHRFRMAREINAALAERRRARAARQQAAWRGWRTRFQRQMEGLKR